MATMPTSMNDDGDDGDGDDDDGFATGCDDVDVWGNPIVRHKTGVAAARGAQLARPASAVTAASASAASARALEAAEREADETAARAVALSPSTGREVASFGTAPADERPVSALRRRELPAASEPLLSSLQAMRTSLYFDTLLAAAAADHAEECD
jgi:hypothetical protein